jgi:hypothetical protein
MRFEVPFSNVTPPNKKSCAITAGMEIRKNAQNNKIFKELNFIIGYLLM